jgi:protocatechuate 3,4-dioxygenase beta subunit
MSDARFSRRTFVRRSLAAVAWVPALQFGACGISRAHLAGIVEDCEWCGAPEAPPSPSWSIRIAPEGEPGEPLHISGRVYGPDSRTPAPGVLLYAYHTDAEGYYSRGDAQGNGRRHGLLRGWMKTGGDGRYEFRTIKPAPYPGRRDPAHIHMTVSAPDYPEYWIDDIWFDDDPLLTPERRAGFPKRGGFPSILKLSRGADGVWRGTRDIKLERVT